MDAPTPQPPHPPLPVKVPMKMPIKIQAMAVIGQRPPEPPRRVEKSAGHDPKRSRVEAPTPPTRAALSSSTSSSSSSSDSRGSTSSSDLSSSASAEATSSETASEPTLFDFAKEKGILNEDAPLFVDEAGPAEPIIPPRPPVIRSFPTDLEKAIERYKERLNREENAVAIKDDNKTVSLGTSKVNYIDPRIICSWAKEQNVPINKIFSSTLQQKFSWALDAQGFNF